MDFVVDKWIYGFCISNDLKKLDTYFKGTTIFASLNSALAPAAAGFPKRLESYLKDVESSAVTSAGFPLFIFA